MQQPFEQPAPCRSLPARSIPLHEAPLLFIPTKRWTAHEQTPLFPQFILADRLENWILLDPLLRGKSRGLKAESRAEAEHTIRKTAYLHEAGGELMEYVEEVLEKHF